MDNRGLRRLLIIKPSSLGDVIHALPVAAAVAAALPDAQVDWVVARGYEDILAGNPAIKRLVVFDRGMMKGPGRAGRLIGFLRELRRVRYDVVVDLQGLMRSALMSWAARADRRIGFAGAREGAALFYDTKVEAPRPDMHAVDRYMLVLESLGVPAVTPEFHIATSDADEQAARRLLDEAGIARHEGFALVAPSARWATKRWAPERFAQLAARLAGEAGLKSVFVGTEADAALMEGLSAGLPAGCALLFGRTSIKTLAALMKAASVVVTNDSGPMHIAAAVGAPTVAIFGPTDPRRTGPYGVGHRVVMPEVDCAPCFRRQCGDVRCLDAVDVARVYDAVMDALTRKAVKKEAAWR